MFNQIKFVTAFAVLAILSFVFLPIKAFAVPKEVILFPNSAHVIEETRVVLQPDGKDFRKGVFIIPGHADLDTLVIKPSNNPRVKVIDHSWRQIVRQDDAKISELRNQIFKLKAEKQSLLAALKSIETQIQFWQLQTKTKIKNISDANNVSAAIGKNIKKAFIDKFNHETEHEKIDKKIKELQEELDRAAGKKETAWEVTAVLSGANVAEALLSFSYTLSECGWSPLYRLEAIPEDSRISFTWEAQMWQSSGQNWSNVELSLATLRPLKSIIPGDLPPWIISPRTDIPPRIRKKGSKDRIMADKSEELETASEALNIAPQEIRQTTFSLWRLGKKTVAAGLKQRVTLQEEAWPVNFSYIVRPAINPGVFFRALAKFPEGKDIPSGLATFMLDGAILGKREFSFAGKEATLYFGVDPLIKATETLLLKQSGEKTFLADKQTHIWERRIDVQNSRKNTALVIVEEPNPQTRDERIKISSTYTPEPFERTPSMLIWTLDVPAGDTKSIKSSVKIEAPRDMNIDLGWRQ